MDIEAAFKNLKSDLQLRPIFHQKDSRIEAHIFVAFLAYCLHVCLRGHAQRAAGGLTPRAILTKFSSVHLVEVHLPVEGGGSWC